MLVNIYKLICNTTKKIYFGSTTKDINKRLRQHEINYKRWFSNKSSNFTTAFNIIKNNNYQIILLECFEADQQARKEREAYYIRTYKCINKKIEGRTNKEWRQENPEIILKWLELNKEHINNYQKNYRNTHKDYFKNYYQIHKDKMKQYYQDNKEKRKQYYEDNKQKIKEYNKNYYDNHKKNLT